MDMEEAWEYAFAPRSGGLFNMSIVILYVGIATHEDLPYCPQTIYYDGYDITKGPPGQYQYHGTAIAGILKGITDNGIGMAGMLISQDCDPYMCYFNLELQCQVICSPNWDGYSPIGLASTVELGDAIYDASYLLRAFVLSISLDMPGSPHIDSAIVSAYENGTTIFAASGNSGRTCKDPNGIGLANPARNDLVIAIGASNYNDERCHYSQYGTNPAYGQIGIDALAPSRDSCTTGVGIVTTDQMGIWSGTVLEDGLSCFDTTLSADYLCDFGGTSAACPQAAGIAMLIFARRDDFRIEGGENKPKAMVDIGGIMRPTPEVIREIIRYSSEDVANNDEVPGVEDTAWINEEYGWGRVNAARAMLAISRGDVNNDGIYNILDINYLIAYKYKEDNPAPYPNPLLGDVDCDGSINVLDIVYLITYKYKDGPRPPLCYKY